MSHSVALQVTRLPHGVGLALPAYQTPRSAGLDLVAALGGDQSITLAPGTRTLVPTGLVIAIPQGYEAQVRPRSGLALKHGVTVLNSPGTIDSDYRGEVQVLLVNLGDSPVTIHRGDRVAQLVIAPVVQAIWTEVPALDPTPRGQGGFGSTGS
jgi:dUTP pyrophosphatase